MAWWQGCIVALAVGDAPTGIGRWIGSNNPSRPHSSFGGRTTDEVPNIDSTTETLAA